MKIDFGSLFSRAWRITWKHKILWVFGFLAMLGGGGLNSGGSSNSGGGSNFNLNNRSSNFPFPRAAQFGDNNGLPPAVNDFFNQLARLDSTAIVLIIVGVCLCLFLIWLVIQILAILGTGGLIGGIDRADTNDKITFREAWAIGRRYFWRLLLLRLLRLLAGIVCALVLIIPMILLTCCTCVGGIILSIIVGFILSYGFTFMDMAVVLEDKSVGDSINRAYTVMSTNMGSTVVVALILFAISLGIGIVSLVLFLPFVGFLLAGLWPLFTSAGSAIVGLIIAALVFLVLGGLACMFVEAVWTTYRMAVIVLAYKQFTLITASSVSAVSAPSASPTISGTL
jgi:hypothetical protein